MNELGIDLILVEHNGERTISAVLDVDTHIGPFPVKGAFKPIAERIQELRPDRFADLRSIELALTMIHAHNMSRRANSTGQSYPFQY